MRVPCLALCLLLAAPAVAGPAPAADPAAALLEGVKTLALPGVPGTLSVFGPEAFPIVAAPSGGRPAPLVAATRLGKGRAVLFGHGYFGDALKVGDTARFVQNVLRWAGGGAAEVRVGVRGGSALPRHLEGRGFTFRKLDGDDWLKHLRGVDVLVLPLARLGERELGPLRARVRAGLGVASGMPGWGWRQLHPGKDLATENMANRLLAPAGLVWGAETVQKPAGGVLRVAGAPEAMTHAGRALDALVAQAEGRLELAPAASATAVANVTRAIREVPPDDRLLLPRLGKLLKQADEPRNVPTHDRPLTNAQGLGKLLLTMQIQRDRLLPPGKVAAHPAARVFPGEVPQEAPRVRRTVRIDTSVPDWHSTGLYAPPGGVIRVRLPQGAEGRGLALRIGAHKDRLWGKAAWRRAPEITVQRPLDAARTQHACAFGGLIYVVVPARGGADAFDVEIQGAVEAPHFVLGRTSLADWQGRVRALPAPWAELETRKVVITVPAEHVRGLDDPEVLMRWWDGVMDGCADLATIPRERARPERYVADEQISAGYMHAGYPIMTHLDAAPRFVDLARLAEQGDWGMFHEMGHNHQHRDWTFAGTVEVTCNLFSLYLMETVCRKGIGHKAMHPESIAKNRALYRKGGAKFGLWKSKPFTALIMYYELRRAFGWEAYKKAFAAYRELPAAQRPKNDAQKRDQWLVRMSRTVGRNLGPFFVSWGIPVSQAALDRVQDLPAWMP